VLSLLPPSLAALIAIEAIQFDQVGFCEFAYTVRIGEQLNAADAFASERLQPRPFVRPKKSIDRDQMLGGETCFGTGMNCYRYIAIKSEDIKLADIAAADFRPLAEIASSTTRSTAFPGGFSDEASAFPVAVINVFVVLTRGCAPVACHIALHSEHIHDSKCLGIYSWV
jgi:hypothetical protein